MNFEMIFNMYCSVLEKHKKQLYEFQFYPENINEIKKSLTRSGGNYSYNFSTISLFIPKSKLPSHSIPRNFNGLEVVLSIKDDIEFKITKSDYIEDPFIKLRNFNIILNCEKKHYTSSWHLDRHEYVKGEPSPSNIHPIYHLTFGGYYMENLQSEFSDEFGRSLILRTPRIMHPPMELILGIDFIFNQFIPRNELDLFFDPTYCDVIKRLKNYFWLPFSLALSKNYCDRISVDNNPVSFDELFVTSVLSF